MNDHLKPMTLSERADALEEHMMHELEHIVSKSALFHLADGHVKNDEGGALMARNPGKYLLMKEDPRLPSMPDRPTLMDYFRFRFASTSHLLQSATHGQEGRPEREGHHGLPPARHRGREFHPMRSWLLGRAI